MEFFHALETNIENIGLQDNVNIVELENFNMYLSLLFLTAIVALYFAFRGTLTANFTFMPPYPWVDDTVRLFIASGADYSSVRNLLVYPIVIFLHLSLIASFYMKLVLRVRQAWRTGAQAPITGLWWPGGDLEVRARRF